MQESPHEREGIDNASWVSFRGLTGLVGLVALIYVAVELVEPLSGILEPRFYMRPFEWVLIVTAPAGWGGLVYACWIRSGRITDNALAFVLALGVVGMSISELALGFPFHNFAIVFLTGTWILNGLGIVWIVQKVRRIRAASNTDAADAAR